MFSIVFFVSLTWQLFCVPFFSWSDEPPNSSNCTGCLTGSLMIVYYNPRITGWYFIPIYSKQTCFFSLLAYFLLVFVLSWNSTFFQLPKNNHFEPENGGGLLQMISHFRNGVIFQLQDLRQTALFDFWVGWKWQKKGAWMSQEVSKWLVNGLWPT